MRFECPDPTPGNCLASQYAAIRPVESQLGFWLNQLRNEFSATARCVSTGQKQEIGEEVEWASGDSLNYGGLGRMIDADISELLATTQLVASSLLPIEDLTTVSMVHAGSNSCQCPTRIQNVLKLISAATRTATGTPSRKAGLNFQVLTVCTAFSSRPAARDFNTAGSEYSGRTVNFPS